MNTDVKIGHTFHVHNVEEGDGSINICAVVIEGCLERDVLIQYYTSDGTALGIIVWKNNGHVYILIILD